MSTSSKAIWCGLSALALLVTGCVDTEYKDLMPPEDQFDPGKPGSSPYGYSGSQPGADAGPTDPCQGKTCEEWQQCQAGTCILKSGRCNEKLDCCTDPYKCDQACEAHTCKPVVITCGGATCADFEECVSDACKLKTGACRASTDCAAGQECDTAAHACKASSACAGVTCSDQGTCTSEGGAAVCNCNHGYKASGTECVADTSLPGWAGIMWVGEAGSGWTKDTTPDLQVDKGYAGDKTKVHTQLWIQDKTGPGKPAIAGVKVQLGYTAAAFSYPVVASAYTWVDATFNTSCTGCGNNHEYVASLPTAKDGTFTFISRVSTNDGASWAYADKTPNFIKSSTAKPGQAVVGSGAPVCDPACDEWKECVGGSCQLKAGRCATSADCSGGATCNAAHSCEGGTPLPCTPNKRVNDFTFCWQTTDTSYDLVVKYVGSDKLSLSTSKTLRNGAVVDLAGSFDAATQTFVIKATGLAPSKYSHLFRMKTDKGANVRPLFVPLWIGPGMRYSGFTWNDSIVYQIFTDRFLDQDPSNNLDNSSGTLSQVTDSRSRWQGGDFAGITKKITEGYFDDMGINTLWISSPVLNSHNAQPGVDPADTQRYASYHSYHPVATGHTHLDDYGYPNPIETAFGTPQELHTLVNEAHQRGIRVMPDFVVNHVQKEANIYTRHNNWFFNYNQCHNNWSTHRIDCWFTTDMPDFNYAGNPAAVTTVVEHALWLIQEFNLDAFRADALKHIDDGFVRSLKAAVVDQVETTVQNHKLPVEPTVFYMVGESLGGWARYHVREDMVQGQVDEGYYNNAKNALLTHYQSLRSLADFSIGNDRAYLTPQSVMGGTGGYPGAIMGNFFGNHDQVRALTEAGGNTATGHKKLRMAQTFLFTSPYNIPMLYQGDDIGTLGGADPGNRAMHRFTGLSTDEQASLANARKVGKVREQQAALRRGTRSSVTVEDYFWVYKVSLAGANDVYVALNRDDEKSWSPPAGYSDALGNCSGGKVPNMTSCVFVKN